MTVWNLGSVNADRFYAVPHIPAAGETLAATGYAEGLGGKGANMAVASARAGSRVELIGAVGADGGWMRDRLASYGVSVAHVAQVEGPSGHANIAVDGDGENQILILPGANVLLDRGQVAAALAAAAAGDIFVCQNETNLQREAADIARAQGLRVAYAAAPFSAGAVGRMLPVTDLLVMNAVEARQLEEATGTAPADLPVRDVVITLGPDGCRWIDTVSGQSRDFPSPRVSAVDTTGAGDTFTGYLLAGLDQGAGMPEALHLALRAAALKVTRRGTADAIPARDEVTGWQP
ncbi:ribokinase [Pseudooceanicola sp. 216_PA32_1]|uniref:Ribokinase n=1 Tax=Pseudooceanicola pacificus TaxID=2676438 RepID=A0A844W299_9RHOB|nr:ribokinase [Pseudooceanicola pacificus]MWB76951.1 ribokinase [Pseudooceanicola pacificus]